MATAPILKLPVEILRQILHAVVLANVGHSFDFYKNFEIFESHCIELSRVCSKFRAVLSPTAVLSQSLTQDINDAKWFLDPNSRQTVPERFEPCLVMGRFPVENEVKWPAIIGDRIDAAQDLMTWLRGNPDEPTHSVKDRLRSLDHLEPIHCWWEYSVIVENYIDREYWEPGVV